MARRKPPASKSDLRFLRAAVMVGVEVLRLREIEYRRINELRKMIVTQIVNALLRRHKAYALRDDRVPADIFEWIENMRMEDTYLKHSYETRLEWASRPILAARHRALSFIDVDGDDTWYYTALEAEMNRRVYNPDWRITVRPATPTSPNYAELPTVVFGVEPIKKED